MKSAFITSWIILSLFIIISLLTANVEFFFYAVVMIALIGLLQWSDKYVSYLSLGLWGFNIWMVLHLLGGLIVIGDHALYGQMLLPLIGEPYHILKYDQVVHAFCYFVFTILVFSVAKYGSRSYNPTVFILVSILAGMGIGSINEILEFIITIFVPDNGVGGYVNTALDIVANAVGACIAGVYLYFKN